MVTYGSRPRPRRVLVAGGGYVGLYTALRLLRKARLGEVEVKVVDPRPYMTYQPFLPEAAAGSIQPRHVVVPLRSTLRRADVVSGWVQRVDHERKVATIQPLEGDAYEFEYDIVVSALGAVSRTLPIPGLAEWANGFKNVEEAISLRNRVLECMDIAENTNDPELRERNLTFVFVGGGFAGAEALGEIQDLARYATRYYHNVSEADLRFYLVEASNRILPEVGDKMGRYALEQLRNRGIDCRLETRLESCVDGHIELSDGSTFLSDTVVWTAGVKANPALERFSLPLDERKRVNCNAQLQVVDAAGDVVPDAWSAGDCAAVPDLTNPGMTCAPSAQHAARQAKQLADNLLAVLRGRTPKEYRHKNAGSVASLGLYKGVAQVYGVKMRGFPAWFMHRTYHMSRVPTLQRKSAVVLDWTLGFFFQRDVTSLWSMHSPDTEFKRAAGNE